MDSHDFQNVQRILQLLAEQWGCPVWMGKLTIRRAIGRGWKRAMADPEARALWDKYFPEGKPTPEQYILCLGHAHERGEDVPFLF